MTVDELRKKAESLGPWRYDHSHGPVRIIGDPAAAPIHGSYGRGRDTMRHILGGLSAGRDIAKWRALDLGCLEGHYTELLCEAGFKEVVALDLSPEHVARAHFLLVTLQGYSNAVVLNGSVEDREFMSSLGRFEVILFHGLLYHLRDPIGIFETLSNVMAERNFLLLSTQFKFNFAEIVSPSPIANFKIRTIPADADGLVRYDSNVFHVCHHGHASESGGAIRIAQAMRIPGCDRPTIRRWGVGMVTMYT